MATSTRILGCVEVRDLRRSAVVAELYGHEAHRPVDVVEEVRVEADRERDRPAWLDKDAFLVRLWQCVHAEPTKRSGVHERGHSFRCCVLLLVV
jgi:hypothetical protein